MPPAVTIVLATRNGAAHLPAQLASIAAQRGVDWRLLASDDGSEDGTRAILAGFAAAHPGRVRLCSGPNAGLAANFLTGLGRAVAAGPGRAVAFCDQDDVWLPEKLARAAALCPPGGAFACRAVRTDAALRPRGRADRGGPTAFAPLLLGRAPGGNRLVLSAGAAARVAASVPMALSAGVRFHDWWAALVTTGTGGALCLDAAPGLLYRQHRGSTLGHRAGMAGALCRARLVLSGAYGDMVAANLAGLAACPLTSEARAAMAALASGQGRGPWRGSGRGAGLGWRAHLIRPAHAAAARAKPSRAISA